MSNCLRVCYTLQERSGELNVKKYSCFSKWAYFHRRITRNIPKTLFFLSKLSYILLFFLKLVDFYFLNTLKILNAFFCNNIKPIVRIQKRVSKSSNYIKRIKKNNQKLTYRFLIYGDFWVNDFFGICELKNCNISKEITFLHFFFLSGLGTRKNSKIHATSFNFSFYMVLCFELL